MTNPSPQVPVEKKKSNTTLIIVIVALLFLFVILPLCIILAIIAIIALNPAGNLPTPTPQTIFLEDDIVFETPLPSLTPSREVVDEISYNILVPGVDNSVSGSFYNFSVPSQAGYTIRNVGDRNVLVISDTDFSLEVVSEYEDEGYGATAYSTDYKELNSPNYGKIYRVQTFMDEERGPEFYSYVHGLRFKPSGICESGYPIDPIQAPCGDGFFLVENELLLSLRCNASTEIGLNKCDRVVESMSKV